MSDEVRMLIIFFKFCFRFFSGCNLRHLLILRTQKRHFVSLQMMQLIGDIVVVPRPMGRLRLMVSLSNALSNSSSVMLPNLYSFFSNFFGNYGFSYEPSVA